jgi:hypothetical protein
LEYKRKIDSLEKLIVAKDEKFKRFELEMERE